MLRKRCCLLLTKVVFYNNSNDDLELLLQKVRMYSNTNFLSVPRSGFWLKNVHKFFRRSLFNEVLLPKDVIEMSVNNTGHRYIG